MSSGIKEMLFFLWWVLMQFTMQNICDPVSNVCYSSPMGKKYSIRILKHRRRSVFMWPVCGAIEPASMTADKFKYTSISCLCCWLLECTFVSEHILKLLLWWRQGDESKSNLGSSFHFKVPAVLIFLTFKLYTITIIKNK